MDWKYFWISTQRGRSLLVSVNLTCQIKPLDWRGYGYIVYTNPGWKCTLSWFTYGATYVQFTSAARIAWVIVKSVVARVCTPANSRVRQAINPSQVLGILIQIRACSNPGCRYWNSWTIPTQPSAILHSCLRLIKHTQRIHDRLLRRVRIERVGLDMNMPIDMRHNLQCQLDHLNADTFVSLHSHWLASPASEHCTAISTASSSTLKPPNLDERFCASDRDSRINAAFDGLDSSPAAIAYLESDLIFSVCLYAWCFCEST